MATALVLAVAASWSGTATAGAATVDSCAIVATPAPGQVTTCPGAHFTDPLPAPVDLSGADLHGSSFAPGRVTGLSGADLARAQLSQAHLVGVDLSGTDLSGADLTGADLSDADLRHAVLTGARLDGATLTRADLSDADLTAASTGGVDWSRTVCPDGATSDSVGATCVNDSSVASGFATGAAQVAGATASPTTTVPSTNSSLTSASTSAVPYNEDTTGAPLAFTGVPVGRLGAIGVTLVVVGLFLSVRRSPVRRSRRGDPLPTP